jgi:hypothetical protein
MNDDEKLLLQCIDDIKWEFFARLKDETQPAGKEFSYVDLLGILDIVLPKYGITKKDINDYNAAKSGALNGTLDLFPEMKKLVEQGIKNTSKK